MTDKDPLSSDLLARIHGRAADYDTTNRFFDEDLAELAAAGYLKALVPTEFGGLGLSLQETARLQVQLAKAGPATALAVNMHHVWCGVAKLLYERGDTTWAFLLEQAGQGDIFAFGLSEAGNDLVLFGSNTKAIPQDGGGYRFFGTKIFTSLSPAWTRLGTMGLDTTSADAPKIVYGFIERDAGGFEVRSDWNTLGMRATQSNTTVLNGAFSPPDRIVGRLDPGPNADPLVFAIFANFELLLAAVYTGVGARALELAVDAAHRRTSMKNEGRSYAHDPDIRWRVASAAIDQDALMPQLDTLTHDVDTGTNHGTLWFSRLVGMKVRATETAKRVVDEAIRVSGGSTFFNGNELGRLYRDVIAGLFHPSDAESAHNTVANGWLGPAND